MFKGMDGQMAVHISADQEVPVNAEDGNHVSICIDQVVASVLGKSDSLFEASCHLGYIINELQIFQQNLYKLGKE